MKAARKEVGQVQASKAAEVKQLRAELAKGTSR